jgi:hypothetical protein
MANPIEQGVTTLKKLPRGVWLTAAGLGIGIGVIILWRNRNKPPADTTNTDAGMTNTGQMTDAGSPVGYGAWGGGVDPGAIGGGNTLDGSTDPFASSVDNLGGLLGLIGSIQDLFGGAQPDSTAATGGVATPPAGTTGGGSGSPAPTNPGTVVATPPTPVWTPQPVNYVPPPAPIPQGGSTATLYQCPAGYPNYNPDRKDCYKVVCVSHVKWHYYSKGDKIKVAGSNC